MSAPRRCGLAPITNPVGVPRALGAGIVATRDDVHAFGAEAVLIVSNKFTTFRLVHELERRGIPAVGPIWTRERASDGDESCSSAASAQCHGFVRSRLATELASGSA
jgi:hypothetical protein